MTSRLPEAGLREPSPESDAVLRVSEVKRSYFGGKMSLRWWYRQIELGRLPHVRAGGAVLVRKSDADAFVAAAYQADRPAPAEPPAESSPDSVPAPRSPHRTRGLRFFGR